jgi:hypothetical protein
MAMDVGMPVAEDKVIAEAIAAFQVNNMQRVNWGLPELQSMTIPCITVAETRPTFYLVPVSMDLSNAVEMGQYPLVETEVLKCVTVFPKGHNRRISDGMRGPEYRKLALQRFQDTSRESLDEILARLVGKSRKKMA